MPEPFGQRQVHCTMLFRAELQSLIGERPGFQRKFWRWQRVGWAGMTALMLLALCGATGAGGLWGGRTVQVGSDTVELARVLRWDADEDLHVLLAPGSGEVDVGLGGEFARYAEVRTIMPEPADSSVSRGRITYRFARDVRAASITIRFRPMRPDAAMRTEISIGDESVSLHIPVLP